MNVSAAVKTIKAEEMECEEEEEEEEEYGCREKEERRTRSSSPQIGERLAVPLAILFVMIFNPLGAFIYKHLSKPG